MTILLINRVGSAIDIRHAGFSLRAGYLFSQKLVLAGVYSGIYQFLYDTNTLRGKMEIIKRRGDEEEQELMKEAQKILDIVNRKKHKLATDIAYVENLKTLVNKTFDALVTKMKQPLLKHHLPDFDRHTWQKGAIDFIDIDDDNPEAPGEGYIRLSELFSIKEENRRDSGTLHLLPPELVMDPDVKELLGPLNGEVDRNGIYLRHALTAPGIIFPGINELMLLRRQLAAQLTGYAPAGAEWTRLYDDCTVSKEQRLQYLQHSVLPHMVTMQALLDRNPIMQQYKGEFARKATVHLYIGEIPAPIVWQFYRDQDVIGDTTLQALQDAQKPGFINSYPVMFIHLPYLYEDAGLPEAPVILTTKKSLKID